MSLLEVKDLHANVGEEDGQEILKGLNLQIQAGEVHAIMGPNGSGKSTLANVLSGRPGYTVTRGTLSLANEDLSHLEPHERAQAGLFLAFQYPVEIPGVSNWNFSKPAQILWPRRITLNNLMPLVLSDKSAPSPRH